MEKEALEIAAKADVIVTAMGDSSEMTGKSSSCTNHGIPDVQQDLLVELIKPGKPVVLVLCIGSPLTLVLKMKMCQLF